MVRAAGFRYALRRLLARTFKTRAQGPRHLYRAIWLEAAAEIGAQVTERGAGVLEIRRGGVVAVVDRHRVGLDRPDHDGGDKLSAQQRLIAAGLSVPDSIAFDASNLAPALAFLAERGAPAVVKPTNTGGGKGITAGVRDRGQLERAVARAAHFSARLMIESQAAGDPYRLLVLDGELLDTVRRRAPRLTGDGRSTIRELIAIENRRRQAGSSAGWDVIRADLDAVLTLEAQDLTLESVPPAGAVVQVKTVNNVTRPEDCETVHEPIARELEAEMVLAAQVVGLRLAGVDVVTSHLDRSLGESGGVILEVNSDPSPHLHYRVADPARATRVAIPILERRLASAGG